MPDFFLLVIGGIITLLVTCFFARKRLSWWETKRVKLIESGHDDLGFEVSHKGNPVKDPRLLQLAFKNTGFKAIEGSSWDTKLEVYFKANKPVVVDHQIVADPDGVVKSVDVGPAYIIYDLRLMNRGDWFVVQILFDRANWEYHIAGKASGLKISRRSILSYWDIVISVSMYLCLIPAALVVIWINNTYEISLIDGSLLGMGVILVLMVIVVFALGRIKRQLDVP